MSADEQPSDSIVNYFPRHPFFAAQRTTRAKTGVLLISVQFVSAWAISQHYLT